MQRPITNVFRTRWDNMPFRALEEIPEEAVNN